MNRKSNGMALLAVLAVLAPLAAQTTEELRARRAGVVESLQENEVLVMRGREGRDLGAGFRQDSNFFYLTGMTEPGGALILTHDGKEIMFGNRARRGRSNWNAPEPGLEDFGKRAGIEDLRPISILEDEIERLERDGRDVISGTRSRSILYRMRRIKSASEIASLRRAIAITCAAQREAMRSMQPGLIEYQLQAIIEHVFRFNGADKVGFRSIIGSGPNACILHWSKNDRVMQQADVAVVDVGGEYGMYTADVTRTLPVSGKFSERQRAVYEVVLKANKAGIAMVKPGVNWRSITRKVDDILMQGLVELGLAETRSRAALRRYYYHGLGHALGLAVHDAGGLGTLEPGMVLTVEPGLYIREEAIGFRIEDDVLVTEDGHEILSSSAPKEVAAIEELMAEKGLEFARYRVK